MKRVHVPSHAEQVIAAKIALITAEFQHAAVVNIVHVPLHVRLVHARVRAKRTDELGVPRVHFTRQLHVPLKKILQREHLFTVTAEMPLVQVPMVSLQRGRGYLMLIESRMKLKMIVHRWTTAVHAVVRHVPHFL